jgi:hypothetical protein
MRRYINTLLKKTAEKGHLRELGADGDEYFRSRL